MLFREHRIGLMTTLLADLYGHQAWADAQHWRAIRAHQPARGDPAIRVRLHHIHIVDRAFLWMVGDQKTDFAMTKPEDFASFESLRTYARTYHDEIRQLMAGMSDRRLRDRIAVPRAHRGVC